MNKTIHEAKVSGKRIVMILEEKPDRIEVSWKLPDGLIDPKDMPEFQKVFEPLLQKYDTDPRPTHIVHPVSGEHAFIYGNTEDSIGIIVPGKYDGN